MARIGFSISNQVLTACAIASATLMAGCSSVDNTSTKQLSAIQTPKPQPSATTQTAAYAVPAQNGTTPTPTAYATPGTTLTPAQQAAAQLGAMTSQQTAAATTTPATTAVPAASATASAAAVDADTPPPVDLAAAAAATTFVVPGMPALPTPRPDIPQTAAVAAATPVAASPVQIASAVPQQEPLPEAAAAMVQTASFGTSPQIPQGMYAMAAMESDFDTGEPMGLENLVAREMIVPMPRPGSAVGYAAASAMPASLTTALAAKPTSSRPELDRLISFYAKLNGIPEELVHRVVKRESTYNPRAYHNGNYGLMQIRYNTAKGLGYEGPAEGLFDAETNLKYATKYLRGAWVVADSQHDSAVKLYASGYYYTAKRKGLLDDLDMR
ncbi:soluble lytic murein transglycosylase-like protein [Pararhizobium capsulatum DSM 1112]|uniref:Soluble lytic murein transglycosylase-like protein n=1 Tax=Pararhizobium capsulatum DSM 1112 TaxID=1121113 RepID=A0ABU0BSM1_9HYPH|nr:lytic transglycosylase domain-containing protein [Pararhizobium capsulatum]MDQ0320957.1 soluble lytic murein transglycosylase-like protein [Pararhizobium capsulatum DSM 1112]